MTCIQHLALPEKKKISTRINLRTILNETCLNFSLIQISAYAIEVRGVQRPFGEVGLPTQ